MTDARLTQELLEHWLAANADARTTLVALEHWLSATGIGNQAVATLVALEHWHTVVPPSTGGPMVTMIW